MSVADWRPRRPIDYRREAALMRRFSTVPGVIEVLIDGRVRKVRERPADLTDDDVDLLREMLSVDPFPGRSRPELVRRYTSDTSVAQAMAEVAAVTRKSEMAPPTAPEPPQPNPAAERIASVRQALGDVDRRQHDAVRRFLEQPAAVAVLGPDDDDPWREE